MKLDDIPRVAEIQVFAWRICERDILSDEYLFKQMTVSKRMEYFNNMLQNDSDENYVFDDGILKAFITISPCSCEGALASLQLSSIYVDPCFLRQGIGAQLLGHVEEIARERDYTEVIVWVLEKNQAAIDFYKKNGYAPDGKCSTGGLGTTEARYRKKI